MTTPGRSQIFRSFDPPADNPADELTSAADLFDAQAQSHRDQAAALRAQADGEDEAAVAAAAKGSAYRAAAGKVAQ